MYLLFLFSIYQQFSPSPIGIQVLDLAASSANFWASLSKTKSASIDISVFHYLSPPKSCSSALAVDEMASALVAARNREIELFLFIYGKLFFNHFSKFRFNSPVDV